MASKCRCFSEQSGRSWTRVLQVLLLGYVGTVAGLSWSWSAVGAGYCVVVSWYLSRGVMRRPEVIFKRLSKVSSEKGCLN